MSVDSRYIRVATKFWQDEKAKALSDDGKLLYLYVLTSPHSNMAGYYVLPKPYVAYDLNWLPERLDKAFSELLKQGLIKYCKQSDVVLIPNFLKYNPMQNQNQAKGAARRVAELPSNTLREDFRTVMERYAEQFMERFTEWFANTDTDTGTDTESDTDNTCPDSVEPERDDDSNPDEEATKTNEPEDTSGRRKIKYPADTDAYQLSAYLRSKIIERDPSTKVPPDTVIGLQHWAVDADRMIRLDNRDPTEATELISWSQQDPFWSANILSMSTFRKQYDRLKLQRARNKSQKPMSGGKDDDPYAEIYL